MEAVEKFLNGGNSMSGVPFTEEELKCIIHKLGKMDTIFQLRPDYVSFLYKYGALVGNGLEIYGPLSRSYDKVSHVISIQRGLESVWPYLKVDTGREDLKSKWLLAYFNGIQYFIDASRKGYICYIDPEGRVQLYAKNFAQFLDRMLDAVEFEREFELEDSS